MNKELYEKWLGALRGNKYIQGRKKLYIEEENSFCCMGVLCDLAGATWMNGSCQIGTRSLILTAYPTDLVVEMLGIDDVAAHEFCDRLTKLNDDSSFSFFDIADEIEDEVREYGVSCGEGGKGREGEEE